MDNNTYKSHGKEYPLCGLVNGVIDGMIIYSRGEDDVYDIYFGDNKVSAAKTYWIFIYDDECELQRIKVTDLKVDDCLVGYDGSSIKVSRIEQRRGKNIDVPRGTFGLSGILLSHE